MQLKAMQFKHFVSVIQEQNSMLSSRNSLTQQRPCMQRSIEKQFKLAQQKDLSPFLLLVHHVICTEN